MATQLNEQLSNSKRLPNKKSAHKLYKYKVILRNFDRTTIIHAGDIII
jgi:hypothetical protein